jgi:hypothetical protein
MASRPRYVVALRNHGAHSPFMAVTPNKSVVATWLEAELLLSPEDPVLAAIKTSTKDVTLDETQLLRHLRKLCEPPQEPEIDVAD